MSINLKQCPISGSDNHFGCEYCPLEFQSRQQRIHHTATHFKSKSCIPCHKQLLCINGDWYELHAGCNTDNDSEHLNNSTCTDTNETKTEAFDFESGLRLKIEEDDDSHDNSNYVDEDYNVISDSPSISESHIEVKTLPPVVQSLTKLKTNLTITRTKTQNTPDITTKNISHWKVKKIDKPSVIKQVKQIKRTFNSKQVFIDHRPKGSCYCDICNKNLANFSTLRAHMRNQHCLSKERLSCNECDKSFSSMGNLNKHKKIHLKCKAYMCSFCGKGFNSLDGLREHSNHHTGQKPYKCNYCEKTFYRKTSLLKHKRIHTREKPYKCNIENCDRAYMYDIDLKRHKFSAHGIYHKKHICQICNKVYSENKLLVKHLQSHSTAQFGTS